MSNRIRTQKDAETTLIEVLQKEINRQCGVPQGYNADIEMDDDGDDLRMIGVSVTDGDGNLVGLFRNEDEVREYFRNNGQQPSWDALADKYVESVRESVDEPDWDIVRTAFCAGMEEMSRRLGTDVTEYGSMNGFEVSFTKKG